MSEKLPQLKALGDSPQQRVLWMAMFTHSLEGRRGLPYVLVGEPGTIKTSILKHLSRMGGLPFQGILGSLMSPMDFLGVPIPQRMQLTPETQHLDPDGGSEFLHMHYAPAGFAVRAAMHKRSVMLFDEANTMPPGVQAAMLRVLFEGVVGELELPKDTRMFLAMNKQEDAAGGWDIAPALANRMGWLEWEGTNPEKFASYLIGSGGLGSAAMPVDPINPAELEAEVDKRWAEAWARATGEVTGFLRRKPENFHRKPDAADAAKPWPSSRTWDYLAHALAGSYIFDLTAQEREMACSAYVGSAVYRELFTWMKDSDLPDPVELLTGVDTFTHNPARIDRTAAVLSSCTSLVIKKDATDRIPRTTKLWEILEHLVVTSPDCTDVCLPSVVAMCRARLMLNQPKAYEVLSKVEPMMQAAGLTA